jgi:long-subunit acyl-CoA synthetase (AMP-forming)/GNAT superfamily N-acetyltransferase
MSERSVVNGEAKLEALLAELREGGEPEVERVGAELLRCWDEAAAEEREVLDRVLVRALGAAGWGERLLATLPLELLEGLLGRCVERLGELRGEALSEERERAWGLLDQVRRPVLLRRIAAAGRTAAWADGILGLIDGSGFTLGRLLAQRCAAYGPRPLFRLLRGATERTISYGETAVRVDLYARALLSLFPKGEELRVAFLCENSLEMAMADLACLSSGIVNVIIPATTTEQDVGYILERSGAGILVVSDRRQWRKVAGLRDRLTALRAVVILDPGPRPPRGTIPMKRLVQQVLSAKDDVLAERRERVRPGDLATIMYTSGTTGTPKGIMFSQRNIVFKRFARALALPEIGEQDRFVCYLPLFHTFGRYLELLGCIFWGATYCFAPDPSIRALLDAMQRWQPTVFISIPLKWMQLYEAIGQRVDVEAGADEEILRVTRELTGGKLRWGLSAAGYLDPEVFRFFQRQGIELMSGFGMTEATGGITMTPPGRYEDHSLGCALPGIEITLAEDGELLIRGPYVMMGYLDPEDGDSAFDAQGWLHTGDLMEMDRKGFIRIVDRKKEIYKNVKGQTIAPQRIENLFRDFESVGRVFLVGDHRPYNTLLIYPNPALKEPDLGAMSEEERRDHFRSLVVTANSFLAPFERIVDFAIIERDFSAERGELTPKGTYRRKTIEHNFSATIRLLYRRTTKEVGGVAVTIPNWFFQVLGLTAQGVRVAGEHLELTGPGTRLRIERLEEGSVRVGDARYRHDGEALALGRLLATPSLWLGNEELRAFAALEERTRWRNSRRVNGLAWERRCERTIPPELEERAAAALRLDREPCREDLHWTALLLDAGSRARALDALALLEKAVQSVEPRLKEAALHVLRRACTSPHPDVARRAFRILVLEEPVSSLRPTLRAFLEAPLTVLDRETIEALVMRDLSSERLEILMAEAHQRAMRSGDSADAERIASMLLQFLAEYGASHPAHYRRLRALISRAARFAGSQEVRQFASSLQGTLVRGLRRWLGPPCQIAIDPETGGEYRWEDVVVFDEEIGLEVRRRLMNAFTATQMVREAHFLFSGRAPIRLEDILPNGVWVRPIEQGADKSIFLVSITPRTKDQFEMVINLNHELTPAQVWQEINGLLVCEDTPGRPPLVERFGGYWADYDLWTEEYIAGETLDRALRRLARSERHAEHFRAIWPSAAWTAMSAFIDLWDRTGEANPAPGNIIVPTHDYQTEPRIVSISRRRRYPTLTSLLVALQQGIIRPIEEEHPPLRGMVGWETVFSAVLEALGERPGLAALEAVLSSGEIEAVDAGAANILGYFLQRIRQAGFRPRQLYFAENRYHRWVQLNPEATVEARVRMLQELSRTYGLAGLQAAYPEVRARFFHETVLRDAPEALNRGLARIIQRLRSGELVPDDLSFAVAELRAHLQPDSDQDYILARLSYPYLGPEDDAHYVTTQTGGTLQSEMVVRLLDKDGQPYQIRHALSAKEVGRLFQLFLSAKLNVQIRPEHRCLVAVNDRGHLIGGLFYEARPEEHAAHMEKVVVDRRFQKRGIATALLEELCNRLRSDGYVSLTTGFFQPQFFYRLGFSVEPRYAGLVKEL